MTKNHPMIDYGCGNTAIDTLICTPPQIFWKGHVPIPQPPQVTAFHHPIHYKKEIFQHS